MEEYKNPAGKFTAEEESYANYIRDHLAKVRRSFDEHGEMICRVLGLSQEERCDLVVRVEMHDMSKWSIEEFPQYRNYFYPAKGETKDEAGFASAWGHHYTTNDHHPEHWVINNVPTDMTNVAIAEMILDWEAMSRSFGGNPRTWYRSNARNIALSPKTEHTVSHVLDIVYNEDDNLKEYKPPILG